MNRALAAFAVYASAATAHEVVARLRERERARPDVSDECGEGNARAYERDVAASARPRQRTV